MNLLPLCILSLMTGTSGDGIDAVLVEFSGTVERLRWKVQGRFRQAYSLALAERLRLASNRASSNVVLITELHAEIGQAYAQLAGEACDAYRVDLVALSGQTIFHIPRVDDRVGCRIKSTLQIGEGAWVLERCGVPVICDFRQSDLAAGGEGAPLVAFGDLLLYHEPGRARAIHNIGGISNLTYLPADGDSRFVRAFDTGPGNCLIDEAAQRFFGVLFDRDGELAARGTVNETALSALLRHPYLQLSPPKSTGREVFSLGLMLRHTPLVECSALDLLATLTAFTAESIAAAYRAHVVPFGLDEVLVAGGGALNRTLIDVLRTKLPVPVSTFEEQGMLSRDREALAFAVMAYFAAHGLTNTLPQVTGARHAVVAGKLLFPPLGRSQSRLRAFLRHGQSTDCRPFSGQDLGERS
ncbi:MAG: Anhydro-N-acetylmuramic acid kinase [Firmicutes bacterium]|nr:Anhydro-N-acetylmuramic acid kinase [candidate division NPL-UPA2 bacterium]